MRLYDEIIASCLKMTKEAKLLTKKSPWDSSDQNQILFHNETAFELGGGVSHGLSGVLLTADSTFVDKDEVFLIGKDILELKEDTPLARITICLIEESALGDGQRLYQQIRKIDYTRYHIYPKDCMLRISAMNQKETLAIGKKAIKNKISFASLGAFFNESYHENPLVRAVKTIFITDESFDFDGLKSILTKSENITKALDHLMNKVKMDCHTCSLQEVCQEVEELCNEEFKK